MKITCTSEITHPYIDTSQVTLLITTFLSWRGVSCDEVIVHLVTTQTITKLHEIHFKDPVPTDCISFPIDCPYDQNTGYTILGEIFICPQTAMEYAQKHDIPFCEELSLYLIHALLHLLGYRDDAQEAKLKMRTEEKSSLDYLRSRKALLSCTC